MRVIHMLAMLIVNQFLFVNSSWTYAIEEFASSLYRTVKCYRECCSEKYGSKWIPANITDLQNSFENKLYGQHLVEEVVVRALKSHLTNNSPSKALVMSFHGFPGSGKNYVARFIAESLFKKGYESKYVHMFQSTILFPHNDKVDIYKLQIQDWIRGNVTECGLSLFIFDEIDKMPVGMIDAIKPFIDYHHSIFGINFRKAIFIFLSNTGSVEINRTMLKFWRDGKPRHTVTLKDLENLVLGGAFEELGGLHQSDLIHQSLVDFYVPFLPLEKQHIELCVRDEIIRRNRTVKQEVINRVVDSLRFFPPENQLYSASGCKRVATKVGYVLMDEHFDKMFD